MTSQISNKSKGLIIDGVLGSEAVDGSGEMLDIEGADITTLEEGHGVLNYEHQSGDDAANQGQEVVGRILFAKKIFGPEDCTNERQRRYWDTLKLPFIYGICRLWDGAGHEGAKALAASIRDAHANGDKILVRFSVEGSTIKKDGNKLKKTIITKVALTYKPCNKSANSGLLQDPHAPDGFVKDVAPVVMKKESLYGKLGASTESDYTEFLDIEELNKTLDAGNMNVAPGALVGGAALQSEDRTLRNRLRAAIRDWPRHVPFRKFLKMQLPDVSDEYLDRFAAQAEETTIKKAQKAAIWKALRPTIKAMALEKAKRLPGVPKKPKTEDVSEDEVGDTGGPLTILGKPAPVDPKAGRSAKFDAVNGILHTKRGSFKAYVPSHDSPEMAAGFHKLMEDPRVSEFHERAMAGWLRVRQHMKAGTLPKPVLMHAAAFSALSQNKPVPNQESMYGHLVDAMHHTGISLLDPDLGKLRQDWLSRDTPDKLPEHSPEHFRRINAVLRLGADSKTSGRKAGQLGSFMLPEEGFENAAAFRHWADHLHQSLKQNPDRVSAVAADLMSLKADRDRHMNKRQRLINEGKPDIGPYKGVYPQGFAPKTTRYMLAMLGGGDVSVPDTHFTRNFFGLDRKKDGNSINYLKGVLWNENNSHILEGMDDYYFKNHDAVKHILNHPRLGHHFVGNERDAIFPAFWKHWTAIVPHENMRGLATAGYNESTDHQPFWDAIAPHLSKSEAVDPLQTAKQHATWARQYGDMGAMMLYFRYIVPKLLETHEDRLHAAVTKMEALVVDLLKDDSRASTVVASGRGAARQRAAANVAPVKFGDKLVKPGRASIDLPNGDIQHLAVLDHSPTHYTAVPREKLHSWEPQDLVKLPRTGSVNYLLHKHPEHVEASAVLNESHAIPEYSLHPHTKALVAGLDLNDPNKVQGSEGINKGRSWWITKPDKTKVYVKAENLQAKWNEEFGESHREALYHNLAHDFWGLGKHVTPTAAVYHPKTGERMTVSQNFDGHHYTDHRDQKATLKKLGDTGELHKMAIMNMVSANEDRHAGNYLLSKDGIGLIDHGFAYGSVPVVATHTPDYLLKYSRLPTSHALGVQEIHPDAATWAMRLRGEELESQMRRHGVPTPYISEARRRLEAIQEHLRSPDKKQTIDRILRSPNQAES